MNKNNRHPALMRRQVALFERNPICRLCYGICLDLAEDYGGVQFDLLRSLEVADALCERILLNPWELQDVDQYYHWIEGRLCGVRPAMACALATVCVTLQCIDNPPKPVIRLARELKGLIIGDANNLYSELLTAAKRQAISIDADTYGDIPPMPKPQRELQELQRKCAEATTEILTLKKQLKMEQEKQNDPKTIVYNYGTYIAEQHNDIHDNHNCRIYATAQPEEKMEADGAERRPRENDYAALVAWLEVEKAQGRDYFADAGMNRSRMCRDLSDILGWIVDQNSLRKAQNK
jgi:hypothetical protein